MDWTVIENHQQRLHTIADAAIPNKAQNNAVKWQIDVEINDLMNKIANGFLENKNGLCASTSHEPCAHLAVAENGSAQI